MKSVGFIGIGNMGTPMAAHLVRAGFDVAIYDVAPERLATFIERHGGTAASSPAECARGRDAIITMLPNDKIVREAIAGEGGAADALAGGATVIDMSTSNPSASRALADTLAPRGIHFIDAPVMGGVVFAEDASLDIMVGGDPAAIERCRPLFAAMGRKVIECGGVGTAHALKALANYVNACAFISGIEAMTIGKRYGLDASFMAEALEAMCAGRNHPIRKKIVPHVLTRTYGTGMALGFIAKDVQIAADAARSVDAFAPLAGKVAELWAAAAAELGPNLDQTEIVRYWEDATGVKL